jgi:hypothetical protein
MPMNSCVKPLKPRERETKASTLHMFSFIFVIILLLSFPSFFKLNFKRHITMDEYRQKILVIVVFFMTNPKFLKKISNIHKKHKKLTRGEENEKEVEYIKFGLGFTLVLHCGFHQNDNICLQQH